MASRKTVEVDDCLKDIIPEVSLSVTNEWNMFCTIFVVYMQLTFLHTQCASVSVLESPLLKKAFSFFFRQFRKKVSTCSF